MSLFGSENLGMGADTMDNVVTLQLVVMEVDPHSHYSPYFDIFTYILGRLWFSFFIRFAKQGSLVLNYIQWCELMWCGPTHLDSIKPVRSFPAPVLRNGH